MVVGGGEGIKGWMVPNVYQITGELILFARRAHTLSPSLVFLPNPQIIESGEGENQILAFKGTVSRDFLLQFFYKSYFPKPLKNIMVISIF